MSALADLRAFWAAARKEWRLLRRYPTMFLGFLFWPVALPLAYVFQARAYAGDSTAALDAFAARTGTAEIAGFLFLGWAAYMWISMILWGPGTALRTEQVRGSLEALFMTPVSRLVILFGPVVSQIIWALWMFAVVGAAMTILFGVPIGLAEALRALAVILVAVPALYGLGALFAAVVLRFGEVSALVQGVRGIFTVFCGMSFPIIVLPEWARAVALGLPPDVPDRQPARRAAARGRPCRAPARPRRPPRAGARHLRAGGGRLPPDGALCAARRQPGAVLRMDR